MSAFQVCEQHAIRLDLPVLWDFSPASCCTDTGHAVSVRSPLTIQWIVEGLPRRAGSDQRTP